MTRTSQTILSVRVEGLGRGSANALWRWALGDAQTLDADLVYIAGALVSLPEEIGFECDFRAGRSTIGGLTFRLFANAPDTFAQPERAFYTQRPRVVARLLEGVGAATTTLVTDTTGLTGRTLILGNEAIYIDGVVSGATYNVTRGVLGTRAQAHGIEGGEIRGVDDDELYDADDGPILRGRRVELLECPIDGDYPDEVVVWSGVIDEITHPTPNVIEVGCKSALDYLRDVRLCERLWRGQRFSYSAPREPTDIASAGYRRVSGAGVYAPGWALYGWGDKTAVLASAPSDARDATVVFSSDLVQPFYADGVLIDWGEEPPGEVWQIISSARQAPDLDGGGRLSNNLATLTLQVLTTTEAGGNYDAAGGATNYDLGVPNVGAGVPWQLVDVAGIERMRDRMGDLLRVDAIHMGKDGEPMAALEWLSSLWRPYGGVVTGGQGGRVTVALFADSVEATLTAPTLDVDDLLRVEPSQRRRLSDAIDTITVSYADRPGQKPITDRFEDTFNKRRQLAASPTTREDLDLLGVNDPQLVLDLGTAYIQRYSLPIPEVTVQVLGDLDLWPGDLVRVTLAALSGRDVDDPVDGEIYLVSGRRYAWSGGRRVTYRLLAVEQIYTRRGTWAPSAQVTAWDGGTSTATLAANAYTTGRGSFATDVEAFSVLSPSGGDLTILSADDLSVAATCSFTSAGTNSITLSGLGSYTPGAGDILVLRDYPNQGAATEYEPFAVIADFNGDFDGGDGFEWGY